MGYRIIAVDFDGTLSIGASYPNVGKPNKGLFDWLKEQKKRGSKIILWTCREQHSHLQEAIDFCKENGLVFDSINSNLPELAEQGWCSRKVFADIYIDDSACHLPWC